MMETSIFTRLEQLIVNNSRHPSHTTATTVLQDLGVPCISLAIRNGDTVTSHCISSGSDNSNSLFQACSISKSVCSLLTFRLIDTGRLSLHTSISAYLSQTEVEKLETPATRGMAKFITISMLLSHTSGLETSSTQGFPGYDVSRNANGHFRAALPDLAEALEGDWPSNTLPIRLKDWPGHVFNYSGGGYGILQLIIEAVTEKSFAETMQEHVFQPLGMQRSTFAIPDDGDLNTEKQLGKGNYARAYYNGYTACEAPHRVNPEQSAAGLWTTPSDLVTLASAIQKSLHDKDGFIPTELAKQMLEEVQAGMARGWRVTDTHFSHNGSNMPGWRCDLLASLHGNEAMSFMTNSAEGYMVGCQVQSALFYLLGWSKPTKRSCVIPFADVSATMPETEVMQRWAGTWKEQRKKFQIEFGVEDEVPWLKFGQMPDQRLWVAAHGKEEYRDGRKVIADLVCKSGIEVLVRLMEDKEGKPLMETWNGATGEAVVMERVL